MPDGLRFVEYKNAVKSELDMENEQQAGEYKANNAEALIGEHEQYSVLSPGTPFNRRRLAHDR
jgi:hypothetical protein